MKKSSFVLSFCIIALALVCAPHISLAAGGGDKGKDKKPAESIPLQLDYGAFIVLDPLVLPIVDDRGISQVVSMSVVIEADSERRRDTIRALTPRLKDAYIEHLYGALHTDYALKNGIINVKMLKDEVHKITVKVLGDDVVEDVLLQSVNQRMH